MRFDKLVAGILGGLLLGSAGAASAAPCPTFTNPVYLQIGDTQQQLIKVLGKQLAELAVDPITLVYVTSGSCTNVPAIYNNTILAAGATVRYVPAGFDTTTATPTCQLDGDGEPVDLANSALFVSACNLAAPPAEIITRTGPVQAYVFAVPEMSTQTAITAEEAYFVFGFGDQGMVAPWDDESLMHIRPPDKSTILALAASIAVDAMAWQGMPWGASLEVVTALENSSTPEKTIGILGAEVYDLKRLTLDSLAFKAFGQWYAYYPDSTSASTDKQNVRDGHYFPWSPTEWLTRVGSPNHARANYIVDLIVGAVQPATFDPLALEIDVGLVPDCAMGVSREYEGGPLALYEPELSCGCFYDSEVGNPVSCEACDGTTCAAGTTCVHGFCEEN